MSLILDALKKAEKGRADTPATPADKPGFNPIAAEEKKTPSSFLGKLPKPVQILIIVVVMGGAGAYYGRNFISKFLPGGNTSAENTTTADPNAPQGPTPEQQAIALKGEAAQAFKDANFPLAKEKWDKIVELTPTDAEAYNNLGVILKKMGNKDGASDSYRTALSLNPTYAEALNNLGVIMLEKLLNEEAEQLFDKAIQANANYADPYFHLALILEDKKDIQGALEKYQTFINLSKDIDPALRSRIEMRMVTLQNF